MCRAAFPQFNLESGNEGSGGGAGGSRGRRGEYKKAPDLATRRALCDQTGGQESQALEETKPEEASNIHANRGERGLANPNTSVQQS